MCLKSFTSFVEFLSMLASWELLLTRALIFLKDTTTDIGTEKMLNLRLMILRCGI